MSYCNTLQHTATHDIWISHIWKRCVKTSFISVTWLIISVAWRIWHGLCHTDERSLDTSVTWLIWLCHTDKCDMAYMVMSHWWTPRHTDERSLVISHVTLMIGALSHWCTIHVASINGVMPHIWSEEVMSHWWTESCHKSEWVMSMKKTCHTDDGNPVTLMHQSQKFICVAYMSSVMSHIWTSQVILMNGIVSHIWMRYVTLFHTSGKSHVTHLNKSCHTDKRGRIPHLNASRHRSRFFSDQLSPEHLYTDTNSWIHRNK